MTELKAWDKVRVVFRWEQTRKWEDLFDTGVIVEVEGALMVDCNESVKRDDKTGRETSQFYALDDASIVRIEKIEE